MIKTIAMVSSLAFVVAAGAACFGTFGSDESKTPPASCEGLQGQAKLDCEKQQH